MRHSHLRIQCGSDLQQTTIISVSSGHLQIGGLPHATGPATAGFPRQNPKGREETLRHQAHRGGDVADPGSTLLPKMWGHKGRGDLRGNMGR